MPAMITASRLKTFRRCQLEDWMHYELGYISRGKRAPLLFGLLVHAGLEAYFLGRDIMQAMIDFTRSEAGEGLDPQAFEVATSIMTGYVAHYREQDRRYEVMAVEQEFSATIDGISVGGKIDAMVRDRATGAEYIVEHKTSSADVDPGAAYWQMLQMDSQISMYFLGARSLGYNPEACIYDVLSKPRMRLKKDETVQDFGRRVFADAIARPEEYYQRQVILRTEAELDRFAGDLAVAKAQMVGVRSRNTDACFRYGSPCEYFDVCTGCGTLEDESRFTKKEWPFSELTPTTEEI